MQKHPENTHRSMTGAQERAFDTSGFLAASLVDRDYQSSQARSACRSVFENRTRSDEKPQKETGQV